MFSAIVYLLTQQQQLLLPSKQTAWVAHCLGLAKLFELWGPVTCSKMPYRHYFEHCRPLMIFAAHSARQETFLSRPEWKSIPFSTCPVEKNAMQYLFDIMSDCPRLWAWQNEINAGAAKGNTRARVALRTLLLNEATTSLEQAHEWRRVFDEKHPDCQVEIPRSFWTRSSGPSRELPSPSWHTVYQYPSLDIANTVCFYNGTHILLLYFIINNTLSSSDDLQQSDREGLVQFSEQMRISAIDIGKSVDFHLLEFQDSAGGLFLIYPLLMAARAFENLDMQEELKWTKIAMAGIGAGERAQWSIASTV